MLYKPVSLRWIIKLPLCHSCLCVHTIPQCICSSVYYSYGFFKFYVGFKLATMPSAPEQAHSYMRAENVCIHSSHTSAAKEPNVAFCEHLSMLTMLLALNASRRQFLIEHKVSYLRVHEGWEPDQMPRGRQVRNATPSSLKPVLHS